jgi:predicted SnoaL-like aldol condensation-catalyzing enzyme
MSETNTAANKAIAIEAITGVFIKRRTTILGKLFLTDYKQHNPTIPNGNASIPDVIRVLPADFKQFSGTERASGS